MGEIYTFGHSTRTEEETNALLAAYGIELVVDVRSFPGSRHCPWFGREAMSNWLSSGYVWVPDLGGRRHKSLTDSPNEGWRLASFRNYADYSLSEEYAVGLEQLKILASENRVAYMCSEAVPWRCHRQIISTSLTYEGFEVKHVINEDTCKTHELGEWGPTPAMQAGFVFYPKEDS